ncbi:MAG: DNA polymerase III subunit gamma/tau [Lachnospiraceae bacterium]|nr:DNA polymerase III subunit gamma/tau [Lachnospiraceae bacterium]
MSYTALYRKFRPSRFEDVKGQDHIVTTLKNQIKAERIGHAYLFCGTRGTGKTTIAKIFAKAVNCEHPVDGSPCNECAVCKAINSQTSMNVIEIDAASNSSVDNVRQIVEEVQYSPTEGRYKVYIIDEVHALSSGAYNALLKTLEEPPEYVIFILATTELHKIPVTILSRCQRYDFHRISIDTIAARMDELLQIEQVEAEEKAVRYIAKAADGSLRDGLSLLDQCIAFYLGEKLTYDKVLETLGAVDTVIFQNLLTAILEENVVKAVEQLEEMVIAGRDLGQFVNDFIWYLRNLLMVKASDRATDIVDVSNEQLASMEEMAQKVDTEIIMRYIHVLSELTRQLTISTQKRVLVETALIRLCRPQMGTEELDILDRIRQLEKKMEQGVPVAAQPVINSQPVASVEPQVQITEPEILPEAMPEDLRKVAENWSRILQSLPMPFPIMLAKARPSINHDNGLLLVFADSTGYDYVRNEEHMEALKNAIRGTIQKEVVVEVQLVASNEERNSRFPDITKKVNMPIEFED